MVSARRATCRSGQVPRKRHTRQGASDGYADGDETGRIRPRHQNHPRPFPSHQPRQKFKLAQSVEHSVPKHQPTCNRTRNRRSDGSAARAANQGQTTRAGTNSAETKAKHQLIPPAKVVCPHSVPSGDQVGLSPLSFWPSRKASSISRGRTPSHSTFSATRQRTFSSKRIRAMCSWFLRLSPSLTMRR